MIGWWERKIFGEDHRRWACSHAQGYVLEVAVETGLNLPFYAPDRRVVGIDLSPEMLEIARGRAHKIGCDITLQLGDAHALAFDDDSYDTVVCTYSLCNIPDVDQALTEMHRVLRPGGRLVLVDHIGSSTKAVFWLQRAIEVVAVRLDGEHLTRRPSLTVASLGFEITERGRFRRGIVERLVAVKE